MVPLLVVSGAVALVAAMALILIVRREEATRRVLRSIASALHTEHVGADLVGDVRSLVRDADEARIQANTYAATLQGAAFGVAILSSTGSIVYTNPAAHLLLDGPGERAVLRSRVTALGQRVHGSGQTEVVEVDIHDPDRRVLSLTAVPVAIDGGGLGSICLYIDDLSTQRRVDAMRTDFVANASHELKTPLGALSLLAETLGEAEDEEVRMRLAKRLQAEATRLANVVDNVLQLAETASLGSEYTHEAIIDVVREAVKNVETLAMEKDITLIDDGAVDAVVACERPQLVSAIHNLLLNAITYTAVKQEPGVVRYRSYRDDRGVCVDVEDTGIGIPSRYTDRVFERFFRVDRARSRESGGTGLGLSIVKNVALAHGGDVAVKSKVGVGSTFTICLPAISEDPK